MVSTTGSWSHSAFNEREEQDVLKDICAKEEAGSLERTGAEVSWEMRAPNTLEMIWSFSAFSSVNLTLSEKSLLLAAHIYLLR